MMYPHAASEYLISTAFLFVSILAGFIGARFIRKQWFRYALLAVALVLHEIGVARKSLDTLSLYAMVSHAMDRILSFRFDVVNGLGSLGLLALLFAAVFLFGNFFCGWLCPEGALQEFLSVRKLSPKIPQKWVRRLERIRPAFFLATIAVCLGTGMSLFKVIFDLGNGKGHIIFLSLLAVGSVFVSRWFCRFLCPVGFVLGWVNRMGLWRFAFKPGCIACRKSERICPTAALVCPSAEQGGVARAQLCISCAKCEAACPRDVLVSSA